MNFLVLIMLFLFLIFVLLGEVDEDVFFFVNKKIIKFNIFVKISWFVMVIWYEILLLINWIDNKIWEFLI